MSIRINGIDKPSTINQKSRMAHGTYHMADNPNLFEPQRSNNFEFVVTDLNNLIQPGTAVPTVPGVEPNGGRVISQAQEILRLSMVGTFVPHFRQEAIEIKRGNNSLRYAGTPSFNSGGTITVVDWIGAASKTVLEAWQSLSYNVYTEKVGLASDYKKDCYLIEYTPDYQVVRQWKLRGCWISNIDEDGYDASSGGEHKIRATIEYDRAEIDTSDIFDE